MSLSVIKMQNPTEPASDFDRTAHENRTPAENRETVTDPFRSFVPETTGKVPLTVSKGGMGADVGGRFYGSTYVIGSGRR